MEEERPDPSLLNLRFTYLHTKIKTLNSNIGVTVLKPGYAIELPGKIF